MMVNNNSSCKLWRLLTWSSFYELVVKLSGTVVYIVHMKATAACILYSSSSVVTTLESLLAIAKSSICSAQK